MPQQSMQLDDQAHNLRRCNGASDSIHFDPANFLQSTKRNTDDES